MQIIRSTDAPPYLWVTDTDEHIHIRSDLFYTMRRVMRFYIRFFDKHSVHQAVMVQHGGHFTGEPAGAY
jgi:hypothetical protein